MDLKTGKAPVYGIVMLLAAVATAIVLKNAFLEHARWYWGLALTIPVLVIAFWLKK